MVEQINGIEITFPVGVTVTSEQQQRLYDVIEEVCKAYEAKHPDRVMWVAGSGFKMLCSPFGLADDEPIPFDESVIVFECSERENYDHEASS